MTLLNSRGISKTDLNQLQNWILSAYEVQADWRAESWEDTEFVDGMQWSFEDSRKAKAKRINPLTINRTFPILNLLHGHYLLNKTDTVAKGRTQHDTETGQIITEGLKFVLDQNEGSYLKSEAFKQQITAGFSAIEVGFNPDPREESIQLTHRSWTSIYWDQYASPWFNKSNCKWVAVAEWQDLDDLKALFPEKAKELDDCVEGLGDYYEQTYDFYSHEDHIEERHENQLGHWLNTDKSVVRVKPVEMWHTKLVTTMFAILPSGYAIELDSLQGFEAQFQAIQQADEVISATVKKMWVTTFLNDLVLQDCPSPYAHDQFPFAPYVGYLDRWNFPYGVPRQIKEQNREVNQRRSMALALLSGRRVIIEKGAAEDNNRVYAEAQRFDSYIEMKQDKLGKVRIDELAALAAPQIDMLVMSEREISEISGATDESQGQKTASRSGTAMREQKQSTAVMTANLLNNAHRSEERLGQLITSMIQATWTGPRVLRITDSVAKTERFVNINEQIEAETGVEIRNDVTQGQFDIKVTTAPETDTTRSANVDLLFAAINKAPQEAIGPLVNLALELSDIPNKEFALRQIREATGYDPSLDLMTQDQRQQYQVEKAQAQQAEQQRQSEIQNVNTKLEQEKAQAEVDKLKAEAEAKLAEAKAKQQDIDQKGYQIGVQAAQQTRNNHKEDSNPGYTSRSAEAHPVKEETNG